ncbi:HET-domain-containing protein [Decorospora gaudefroyi]|uniref:HET-domain-containing protein n=1 Tax=Decorospora gaudefroyi TaxID=184978 RepID=A0A6A5KM32_9PLEO|nr:HET-domain-containing protein [Decorospora gaudefroyi]
MAYRIFSKIAKPFRTIPTDLYTPLNPDSPAIRLLQLQPGAWEDDIRAVLGKCSIADARDRYITISYSWGHVDVVQQVLIKCNDISVLVSWNLFTALRRLRKRDRPVLLWADAVCINQEDPLERTHQVSLMGQIYSNSQETVIWLGEPTANDDVGCRLLRTRGSSTSHILGEESSQMIWKGDSSDHRVRDLYLRDIQHSYATGVSPEDSGSVDIFGAFCLIQCFADGASHLMLETLYNDKVNALQRHGLRSTWHGLVPARAYVRGSRSSRIWEGLERLMSKSWWQRVWVVQETVLSHKATVHYGMLSAPWSMFTSAAVNYTKQSHTLCLDLAGNLQGQHYLDQFANQVLRIEETRSHPPSCLENATMLSLLWKFRPLEASDKRDKVFALLGLITNWQGQSPLLPNYRETIATTFIQTTVSNIRRAGSLLVLAGDLEAVLNRQRLKDIPSWVMDWSLPCLPTEIERVNSLHMYNASGGCRGTVRFDANHALLEIEAMYIDQVVAVGEVSRHTQISDTCAVIRACNLLMKSLEQEFETYPTGGTYDDAFWRTLIGDSMHMATAPHTRGQAKYCRAKAEDHDAFRAWRMWSRCISRDTLSRTASFSQRDLDEGISSIHHALKTATASRRFFITRKGYMGIGPKTTMANDIVHVFKGSNVPFITRSVSISGVIEDGAWTDLVAGEGDDKNATPATAARYRLVGDCFTYGMMDGEAFEQDLVQPKKIYLA